MWHLNDEEINLLKHIFKRSYEYGKNLRDLIEWLNQKGLLNERKVRKLIRKSVKK